MTFEPREESTTIATLIRVRPDLLEIHYRVSCFFSGENVQEVQDARRIMMGEHAYATLTFIPEDSDFDLAAMRTDHRGPAGSTGRVLATAIVTDSTLMERLIAIYFKYNPQMQGVLITDKEDEARAWIDTQLDEIERTGASGG